MEGMTDRNKQIVQEYLDGILSKTELGRKFGISRERIGQLVKKVKGTRDPALDIYKNIDVDWKRFKELVKKLGITRIIIARQSHVDVTTVSRVLMGDKRYIGGRGSLMILWTLLKIFKEQSEMLSNIEEAVSFTRVDNSIKM